MKKVISLVLVVFYYVSLIFMPSYLPSIFPIKTYDFQPKSNKNLPEYYEIQDSFMIEIGEFLPRNFFCNGYSEIIEFNGFSMKALKLKQKGIIYNIGFNNKGKILFIEVRNNDNKINNSNTAFYTLEGYNFQTSKDSVLKDKECKTIKINNMVFFETKSGWKIFFGTNGYPQRFQKHNFIKNKEENKFLDECFWVFFSIIYIYIFIALLLTVIIGCILIRKRSSNISDIILKIGTVGLVFYMIIYIAMYICHLLKMVFVFVQ